MQLQLETIINALDDAVLVLDEARQILFLNPAAARLFDCEGQKVLGHPLARFPEMAAILDQLKLSEMHLSADSPKGVRRLEGKKSAGEAFSLEALVTCVTADGRKFYIVDIRDISLQQQMEKALFQSRKSQAIGALTRSIAHDFNNVLTSVISQLELALASPELHTLLKENLVHARTSARRGAELVTRLQGFSRQAKPKLAPAELPGLVEQVVLMLRRNVEPRVRILYRPAAEKLWPASLDASQLVQALMNIGLNACDAMPDGAELAFELDNATFVSTDAAPHRRAGDFVRLTLSAPGLETLRSSGADPANQGPSKALGPALTGAVNIVGEHGGWVEFESTPARNGQLHVLLPRTNEPVNILPPRPAASVDTAVFQFKGGTERILVVDDEELVRMVIRAVLGYRGYQITEAANAEEAFRKYLQPSQPHDLILMDLHMPGMNGKEALLHIRRSNPSAKAILFSGTLPDAETRTELRGIRLLQKPFENQELVRLVRETLDAQKGN